MLAAFVFDCLSQCLWGDGRPGFVLPSTESAQLSEVTYVRPGGTKQTWGKCGIYFHSGVLEGNELVWNGLLVDPSATHHPTSRGPGRNVLAALESQAGTHNLPILWPPRDTLPKTSPNTNPEVSFTKSHVQARGFRILTSFQLQDENTPLALRGPWHIQRVQPPKR